MNKYISLIFAFILMAFTACRDEAEIPSTGSPVNVVEEASGTYTGTWTMADANGNVVGTYSGSLTVGTYTPAPEEKYVCMLTLSCAEYAEINGTGAANILKQSRAYRFYNEVANNGLGSTFTGSISFDGACTMSYKKTITEGRKKTTYFFTFNGIK